MTAHAAQFSGGHSRYQVENFIINSQGHLFFRYKQACRELAHRLETVGGLNGGELPKGLKCEIDELLRLADDLRAKLDWDNLSAEQKELLEQNAWYEKAKHMMAVDLICSRGQAINKNTIEFILQLPFEFKKDLIKYVLDKDPRNLIEWAIKEH